MTPEQEERAIQAIEDIADALQELLEIAKEDTEVSDGVRSHKPS